MSATTKVFQDGVVDQVKDVDMNGLKNENNTLISSTGQALNTGDNEQTTKAVADYASKGDFYVEAVGSAADAYVLDPSDSQIAIHAYQDGMSVRFNIVNANTGASTIDVDGLGVQTIEFDGNALIAGDLLVGEVASIRYDGTNFQLIKIVSAPIIPSSILNYNSSTSTILKSRGISGVVKNGVGDLSITFSNPFADTNYQVSGNNVDTFVQPGSQHVGIESKAVGVCRVHILDDDGTPRDSVDVNVAFFGG